MPTPQPRQRRNRPASVHTALNEEDAKVPDNCACEPCAMKRTNSLWNIRRGNIHDYSYAPRWSLKAVAGEDPRYYLGVELETDRPNRYVYGDDTLDPFQAVTLRLPKALWIAKHDSSVSGPEFVSHPASLAYWQQQRKRVGTMLENLRHAGFRSHDNDNCGMHVNISASAFDGEPGDTGGHFVRFLTLVHGNPRWSMRMSQRTAHSASHWAKLDTLPTADSRQRYAQSCQNYGYNHAERYTAVNVPALRRHWGGAWTGRYEFRLPRGTLRLERFYKNLEWTAAMVEYTRETPKLKDCVPARFMPWVLERSGEYPDLAEFIAARFGQ